MVAFNRKKLRFCKSQLCFKLGPNDKLIELNVALKKDSPWFGVRHLVPHIASCLSLEQSLRRRWWRGRGEEGEEEDGDDVDGEEDGEDGEEDLGEDGEGEVGGLAGLC